MKEPAGNMALEDEVCEWLHLERAAAAHAISLDSAPEVVPVSVLVATDIQENGATYRNAEAYASPFERHAGRFELVKSPPRELALVRESLADRLREIYDPSRWRLPRSYGKSPLEQLLLPLRDHYLRSVTSIDGDDELARELVRETLDLFARHRVVVQTRIALGGLRIGSSPIHVRNVSIRPLSPQELGDLAQEDSPSEFALHWPRLGAPERVVLEISTEVPSTVELPGDRLGEKLVLAIQLLGFEPHGIGTKVTRVRPNPTGMHRRPLLVPPFGEWRDFTSTDLEKAFEFSDLISDGAIESPTSREDVALHRFALGASRSERVDSLVDYVIALEASLLPRMGTEVSFRFRILGAAFIASSVSQRKELATRLAAVYTGRSNLVHGSKFSLPETAELAKDARRLAELTLMKCLEEGWPRRETIENLIFELTGPPTSG